MAIFTQVEVAYNLVRLSEIDFGVVSKQAADLKKDIKQRERGRLSADAEISLLNDRIKLLALQNEQSQIAAEKALALRALYFYAGFSPFTRTLLKNEIKDIVVSLRASFNKDMVEMLAAVPAEEAYDEKSRQRLGQKGKLVGRPDGKQAGGTGCATGSVGWTGRSYRR